MASICIYVDVRNNSLLKNVVLNIAFVHLAALLAEWLKTVKDTLKISSLAKCFLKCIDNPSLTMKKFSGIYLSE